MSFQIRLAGKEGVENLIRTFKKVVKRAGIVDFTFHDLRHTFATRLAQMGVDLYTISKLLGHKDIKTKQRYAYRCNESLRRAAVVMERICAKSARSNEKGATLNA